MTEAAQDVGEVIIDCVALFMKKARRQTVSEEKKFHCRLGSHLVQEKQRCEQSPAYCYDDYDLSWLYRFDCFMSKICSF